MTDRDLYVNVVGEKKKDYWLKGMEQVQAWDKLLGAAEF